MLFRSQSYPSAAATPAASTAPTAIRRRCLDRGPCHALDCSASSAVAPTRRTGSFAEASAHRVGYHPAQMGQEREESQGYFEMLWDCDHCDARGLLAKSQRHCANCGAPQNPDKRYFPQPG